MAEGDLFEGRTAPLFLTHDPLTAGDLESVRRLMEGRRFDESLILGAGARCRFGGVRVLVCAPVAGRTPEELRPFPTTFWLLCPWLVRRAGALESEGGVRRLEAWLSARDPEGWRAYNRLHQRLRLELLTPEVRALLRRDRPELLAGVMGGGVGGIRLTPEVRVKCLHLQAASWLALGHHPAGEWLREVGLDGDCGGERLSERDKGGTNDG